MPAPFFTWVNKSVEVYETWYPLVLKILGVIDSKFITRVKKMKKIGEVKIELKTKYQI